MYIKKYVGGYCMHLSHDDLVQTNDIQTGVPRNGLPGVPRAQLLIIKLVNIILIILNAPFYFPPHLCAQSEPGLFTV
jgi:hypothetical protein